MLNGPPEQDGPSGLNPTLAGDEPGKIARRSAPVMDRPAPSRGGPWIYILAVFILCISSGAMMGRFSTWMWPDTAGQDAVKAPDEAGLAGQTGFLQHRDLTVPVAADGPGDIIVPLTAADRSSPLQARESQPHARAAMLGAALGLPQEPDGAPRFEGPQFEGTQFDPGQDDVWPEPALIHAGWRAAPGQGALTGLAGGSLLATRAAVVRGPVMGTDKPLGMDEPLGTAEPGRDDHRQSAPGTQPADKPVEAPLLLAALNRDIPFSVPYAPLIRNASVPDLSESAFSLPVAQIQGPVFQSVPGDAFASRSNPDVGRDDENPGGPAPVALQSAPSPFATASAPAAAPRSGLPGTVQPVPAVDSLNRLPEPQPPLTGAQPPRIALVIDDLGMNTSRTRKVINLPARMTLAFLPYGQASRRMATVASEAGHEVILHLPMEPQGPENPGPNALLHDLDPQEFSRRLEWAFGQIGPIAGFNNHMGSLLTREPRAMARVMRTALTVEGAGPDGRLYFLDSVTSADSIAYGTARAAGMRAARRHVFIDHHQTAGDIRRQLERTAGKARSAGVVIAIGHPHKETLTALAAWIPEMRREGMRFVTVGEVIDDLDKGPRLASRMEEPAAF